MHHFPRLYNRSQKMESNTTPNAPMSCQVFFQKRRSKGKMEKASVVSSGENELLWKSEPQTESIISVTLSRAVTSLLTARPNKLHDSISRLSSSHSPSPTASLHDSLRFFHTYVTDAVNHNRSFDQLLLPIIHSVIQSQSPPLFFFQSIFVFCNTVFV